MRAWGYDFLPDATFEPASSGCGTATVTRSGGCGCGGACGGSCRSKRGSSCGCSSCRSVERVPRYEARALLRAAGHSIFPTRHSYPNGFQARPRGWIPGDAFGFGRAWGGPGGPAAPPPGMPPKQGGSASGPGPGDEPPGG
jgi:hypothetical protein